MNTPGLFVIGAVITLIVVGALAVLVYGAILDGRIARRERERAARSGKGSQVPTG